MAAAVVEVAVAEGAAEAAAVELAAGARPKNRPRVAKRHRK